MRPWAYYNEFDPYAAQWLRNLIKENLIAAGDVDERSIVDVRADDVKGYTQCHWFAGIGGWSLALRLAGWPDDRSVWTGSCPCQPFSLAGARKGFDDSRHLWPEFARLIRDASPATVFGEQVASASDWLGIVRGDLDAMGYAVGAIPIEAASAGADHLRDRFWFVGVRKGLGSGTGLCSDGARQVAIAANASGVVNAEGDRRGKGRSQPIVRSRRTAAASAGLSLDLAEPGRIGSEAGLSGSLTRQEGNAGESFDGSDQSRLAHADEFGASDRDEQRSGEQCWPCGDQEARDSGNMAEPVCADQRRHTGNARSAAVPSRGEARPQNGNTANSSCPSGFEWVIGADGKARRVKSGIRLLAHGFPNRVGLLRGFGNAIDPRPASEFIRAFLDCRP